jgi:hypothetical protein
MKRQTMLAAVFAISGLCSASVNAKEETTLTIDNAGAQFMVRKFDNGERCSTSNRGKFVGVSGRNLHRGERNDSLEISATPGQPFEIVLAGAGAGGRFRVEPEAGLEYLAQLRRSGDQTFLSLHSRALGSDDPFQLIEDAPVAAFKDDFCPEARWSRLDYRTPASPSAAPRSTRSSIQYYSEWQERRELISHRE